MRVPIQLRWSDMDAQRHVNNARFADYLQEARVHLLDKSGLLDTGVVVVKQQIQFKKSLGYSSEMIEIELGIFRLGVAKLEVGYHIYQGEELIAKACTVLAPYDFQSQRLTRLTTEVRSYLDSRRIDFEQFSALEAPALNGRGLQTLHYPRWSDVDRYGHINNVLAVEYLQQARIEVAPQWDEAMGRAGAGGDSGQYNWVVARQDVDYLAQMHYSTSPLKVVTALVKIGQSAITSAAEIFDQQGELVAQGRTVVVCTDQHFTPVPLPNRSQLESWLVK